GMTLWLNGGGGTPSPEPEFGWFPMDSGPMDSGPVNSTPAADRESLSPCPSVAPSDEPELPGGSGESGDARLTVIVVACAEGSDG
ncbi:hypothetical protein CCS38_32215, partial [Streptomyces purpurogeneiscleroticus]|nr:hypothetical protein [Streptomyces purpurogeneiscleroticus]